MVTRSPQHQAIIVQLSSTTQSFNQTAAINKKFFNLCWKIASAWSLFGIAAFVQTPVFAQSAIAEGGASPIAPDNTLGAESSNVVTNFNGLPLEVITGGATRGINLFHSFREFNISEGRGAYFFSPSADIQNILARVTGSNRSEILGILGTFGESKPNLFLMNPNGIIFGKNASLDVDGSFAATTANAIQFGERGNFSATNPKVLQLLTINPSAFLFSQINKTASIQNNAMIAQAGKDPAGFNVVGLRVPDGKSLLLVGGNVNTDGGQLNAYGGRVELGGLAEPGNVNLLFDGDNLRLGFPENVTLASVSLTNQARVYVEGAGDGDIAVNARNIEISGGSILSAGIGQGLGTPEAVAGDITLNATGEIKVADSGSRIRNLVLEGSKSNGGNIFIDSGSFLLRDSARLNASTSGQGNAGNVTVIAKDAVSLVGGDIFNNVESGGVGNTGGINIKGSSLSLTDGAQLQSRVRREADNDLVAGQGDGGTVDINVTGAVTISGTNDGNVSAIFTDVERGARGNGGNIKISSGSFFLSDGAQLIASTSGQGNAGNVTVIADIVSLAGGSIFSNVKAGGVGDSEGINIKGSSFSLTDGAQLQSGILKADNDLVAGQGNGGSVDINVTGAVTISGTNDENVSAIFTDVERGARGNGGNIKISSGSFFLSDGAQLIASTSGQGNAGNVTVIAKNAVSLVGGDIFSRVKVGGVGDSGDINIRGSSLSLTDGAQLQSGIREADTDLVAGKGIGGTVDINVRDAFTISGTNSGIFGSLGTGAVGQSGDIKVEAGNIFVTDGGEITFSTFGKGDSGNISITARDAISLDIGGIYNNVQSNDAEGNAGNIDIITGSLSVTNGAQINSFTRGRGNAGNITIQARDTVSLDGFDSNRNYSALSSNVLAGAIGDGGKINITAGSLSLSNGGELRVSVNEASDTLPGGQGIGGTVDINVRDALTISDNGSGIFGSLGTGAVGSSGNIQVEAGNIFVTDGGEIISSTFGKGDSGNISITARDAISLDIGGIYNNVQSNDAEGNAGNIDIITGSLSVTNGAQINSFTRGRGNAGNITIQARDAVIFDGESDENYSASYSGVETGAVGNGGSITITSGSLFLTNSGTLGVSVDRASEELPGGQGIGGNININVRDAFTISGTDSSINAFLGNGVEGKGGEVNIQAENLFIKNGGEINSSTYGRGDAGKIFIGASESVNVMGVSTDSLESKITASASETSTGNGGSLTIETPLLNVADGGFISSTSEGTGNAGILTINANTVRLDNQASLNTNTRSPNKDPNREQATINLNTQNLTLRGNSNITTNATGENVIGGNINIDTDLLIALENSRISANSDNSRGGRVRINAQGVFVGTQPSDVSKYITATSGVGLSGNVDINSPDNSSIQNSLTSLPTNAIDTNALIANSCIARANKKQENSFIITGGGALPNRPGDVLISNYSTDKVRGVNNEITSRPWKKGDPIVEPTGVYRLSDGRLVMSRPCE